ncbi:MAG: MerR family transcriptional regulator [Candidatus Babeliales bacterium]
MKRKKGHYSISAVAEMFSVHQQTIRLYEKEGLVKPKRSAGGTRMYSEEDIDQLEEIIHLTNKLGVNIAGVTQIIKLKKQINKMQQEMNKLFDTTQAELDDQVASSKQEAEESLNQLMKIKKDTQLPQITTDIPKKEKRPQEETDIESWEIEYDD